MILRDLCDLIGVSGYETKVIDYLYSAIFTANKCDEIYIDKIGNLICLRRGTTGRKNIIITAHADEVGFQVMEKSSGDIFHIKNLGNIKTWNAINQQVKSQNATGVIYAIDYSNLQANNFNNLYLMRLNGKIQIGDVFTFARPFQEGEKYYLAKSLDNRTSCYCLYKLIMSEISTIENIYYVFTVQEEINMRGSRVVKTLLKPDLCITLDVSPENEMNSIKLGGGVGIKISDSVGVSSCRYVELAKDIAQRYNIKHQFEVSNCGTSELIISNEIDNGSCELGISVPCKFIHSSNTLIYKKDVKKTIKLMEKIISIL